MNKLVASLIGSLLAGMLAIGGCGSGGDDASSSNPPTKGVGTLPTVGTSGTGTGASGQALVVRLGTDNLVQSDPPVNRKLYVAIVTDLAGNPVGGATVTFSLQSGSYLKGRWNVTPAATPPWAQAVAATCPNEDSITVNNILDPGEDVNGNGVLDSLGRSSTTPTGTSDASGIARTTLVYPKDAAQWTELTLVASSGAGTAARVTFILDGVASDYTNAAAPPPGEFSPFGLTNNCGNLL